MAGLRKLIFAVLLRALAVIGSGVLAYGSSYMFSTAGVMPNAVVIAGLVILAATSVALGAYERRLSGLWPALLIVGVPFALYSLGSWGQAECPEAHPPITASFSCAPPGTHVLGVVAPVIALAGIALFGLDIRALARRAFR